MITAVQEQERQRQRNKSAVSGPPFEVQMMPALGDMQYVALPSAPSCTVDTAPSAPSSSSTDLTGFLGRSVGTGQCVALVQAANPALGHTAGWTGGAAVQGNTALRPGTAIATFNGADRYANATDGSSHAAIYLGQDQHGMVVMDQWAGSSASVRTIPWSNPGAAAADTGTAFRVVRTT